MKLLYVDACVRGDVSRTRNLAKTFLAAVQEAAPEPVEIICHDLTQMPLSPLDADMLARRERLCDVRNWADPMLAPAVDFQSADAVVIAAPYWDLSFPSALKVWVEHMWVRNLTFRYENERPIGLCRSRASAYITTCGSYLGHNHGTAYMADVLETLGCGDFTSLAAEALDLDGSDVEAIMTDAFSAARDAGAAFARSLTVQA